MVGYTFAIASKGQQTDHDTENALANALDDAPDAPFTLLYIGTPGERVYEPEFDDRVRMDLKRDLRANPVIRDNNGTEYDNRTLFEKYQFFTPGMHTPPLPVVTTRL